MVKLQRTAAWLLALAASMPMPVAAAAAPWALDPSMPGERFPAVGRSVFEEIVAQGVPFPFDALLRQIDERIGCTPGTCIEAVLVPLGRSLQRNSAAPGYFQSPRVVIAVTGEGAGPVFARNRLFIGYQPRTALLEVISYNDADARFEFQIVHDYREGATPRVDQAERLVCLSCHQNHGPIFSRALWLETNANPRVAERLEAAAQGAGANAQWRAGVVIQRGVDVPNAIDAATDAANLLGVTQRLWREACDVQCRGAATAAALEYRLSGGRQFEPVPGFTARFAALWPDGLAVPNPDLPNRDPLAVAADSDGRSLAEVASAFDALQPRAPLEVWTARDPWLERRFVIGLAAFLADADLSRLQLDRASARKRLLEHPWQNAVLSRGTLLAALDQPSRGGSQQQARAQPTVHSRSTSASSSAADAARSLPQRARAFAAPCAGCHATAEITPPNFLAGSARRVEAALRQCAPRIYVRLAMWQQQPATRAKVPMPPPRASESGRPYAQSVADPRIAELQRTVAAWLTSEQGEPAALEELLARGYESLRPCLPEGM
jgi:hypothetical protein